MESDGIGGILFLTIPLSNKPRDGSRHDNTSFSRAPVLPDKREINPNCSSCLLPIRPSGTAMKIECSG